MTFPKIMKFHYLIAIALCVTAGLAPAANEKTNVLFIAIDDLNDWVGCFGGNPQAKTPNLDKFNAEGGMAMMDAHGASTVCGPSRSSLLTGKFPHRTGVYGNETNLKKAPLAKDLITLPQYFGKHGYHTLSRGKIFHAHGADHGQWAFDEGVESKGGVGVSGKRPLSGLKFDASDQSSHAKTFDWGPTRGNDETQMKDYLTAEWAVEQLKSRDFAKPFFMAIGISKPHLPWYVPQKYFDMYPLDQIEVPKTLANDLDDVIDEKGKAWKVDKTWAHVEKAGLHKEAVRAYLANVSFVDDCIGVLLDGLEKSKYADNTIVVIWGDHGWHLGEKQRYGKTLLWQESCRVPLMVKVPGVTKNGQKCQGVVNLIDLYPTLIDLCGLPNNEENDGRSFAELLKNPTQAWNTPTLTDYGFGGHRIYDGRYSYILFDRNRVEQLYDHQEDPMEWHNLVRDPKYAEVLKRLKALVPTKREPESPKG